MQFFTLEWWRGCQTAEQTGDPCTEYARHFDRIRTRLPVHLLTMLESVSLHDSRMRQFVVSPGQQTVQLLLENYAGDERFTLTYRGVERFESWSDPNVGLRGPHGYGDLGYDEVDVLSSGVYEHRLLFSSGIELGIVFHEFEFGRS